MSDDLPATRAQAIAAGVKFFFTGVPCKRGHLVKRRTGNGTCESCLRASAAEWDMSNPGRKRELFTAWYKRNADAVRAKKLAEYHQNPDAWNARNKAWHKANLDYHSLRCAKWREANPEVKRTHEAARRARKAASSGVFTKADVDRIYRLQKGKCAYCRMKLGTDFHRDHIIPLKAGGRNDAANIQLTCRVCNQSKSAKMPHVYAREVGLLI